MEDGFQAIQFALDRVPFRASPFIAKNILLITDEGRVPIPEGENLTRPIIEQQLKVASYPQILIDTINVISINACSLEIYC